MVSDGDHEIMTSDSDDNRGHDDADAVVAMVLMDVDIRVPTLTTSG